MDWVCVSPKIGMPGGRKIIPEVLDDFSDFVDTTYLEMARDM